MENQTKQPELYSEQFEHDNCGIGAIVSIKGIKTHQTVSDALSIVENLEQSSTNFSFFCSQQVMSFDFS